MQKSKFPNSPPTLRSKICNLPFALPYTFKSSHVRTQHLRYHDAPIFLLVIFQHRNHGSPHSETGAVERVDKHRPPLLFRAVADLSPARLKVLAVGARADLPVRPLPGKPNLQVIRLRGGKAQIAGAELHNAIGNVQPAEIGRA